MAQILDLGKIRFQFKGEWSAATEYQFNDVVSYKGNAYVYISTAKTTNTLTSNTQFWGRMSSGFDFSGSWAVGTTYGYGSVVKYGGNIYVYTNSVASAGNLPTNTTYWTLLMAGWNYSGAWSSATAYRVGDVVTHGGVGYVAVLDSTNQNPDSNTTYWSTIINGFQSEGAYNGATAYQKNDLVSYGGNTYIAKTNTTGNLPTNTTYWSLFVSGWNYKGAWSSATAYAPGDVITHGGIAYIAVIESSNQNPQSNTTYWSTFVTGMQYEGAYNAATAYQKNDLVLDVSDGSTYIALQNTTGNTPATSPAYWSIFVRGIIGTSGVANLVQFNEKVVHPVISSGVLTLDMTQGTIFDVTVDQNITQLNITNYSTSNTKASSATLILRNSIGAYTVTWAGATSVFKFSNSVSPLPTQTAGKFDVFAFLQVDGTDNWISAQSLYNL